MYVKKYTPIAEGYVQILTYKHSWNHTETAALGGSGIDPFCQLDSKLQAMALPQLFWFQCFLFQASKIITT